MTESAEPMLELTGVSKSFVMHLRDSTTLPVMRHVAFRVSAGECVVLGGPSGIGKSSVLKMIYGNYRTDAGEIRVRHRNRWVDVARSNPRVMLRLRRSTLGYVSQFLRCIPRVSALDIVAASAAEGGLAEEAAQQRAAALLGKLNLPEKLWSLPPATFSGGEQQRVNIAVGFAAARPVLLLDEPTASLDAKNRAVVVELIQSHKRNGAAIVGIFHDSDVREQVADRVVDMTQFSV